MKFNECFSFFLRFAIIAAIVLLLTFQNHIFSSAYSGNDRRCLSYDGTLEVVVSKPHRGRSDFKGSLDFIYNSQAMHAEGKQVSFEPSGTYADAEFIHSKERGMYVIVMPDGLHAFAGLYKDMKGTPIKEKKLPVLCFKQKEHHA